MRLLHWGLILRYTVYGVLPLILSLVILERYVSPGITGICFVGLALLLPFVAVGWLGYQHWRHRHRP